jgi:beta-mannosidase
MDYMGQLPPGVLVQVRIEDLSGRIVADTTLSDITIYDNSPRRITGYMMITEPVDLWWPVGYGAQTLYNFIIQIQDNNNKTLATVPKRTGFRTVVLDQRPISSAEIALGIAPGNKWNFEINGNEVFCKGSSIVPPDAFWPRVSQDHIKDIFTSAVDSVSFLSLNFFF